MKIFCDMDGVLADFDEGYFQAFGVRADKAADNVDWEKVRRRKNFYRDLPPMVDAFELWDYIERFKPPIITGVPHSVPEAPDNKRAWVAANLGEHVKVICCKSKDKALHARPGDVLIDDWTKYQHVWEAMGGIFVHHTSARETIRHLEIIFEHRGRPA